MERIKSWIESAGSYENSGNFSNLRERTMSESYRPPSIIRTSNSYDNDDEQFSVVSLNLLSRFECLGLSQEEAVKSVLIYPRDRSSYFEALCIRKRHASHYSPTTANLIHDIDRTFGIQLRKIVEQDGALTTTTAATMMMHHVPSCVIKPPPQVAQEHHHQHHHHHNHHNHHQHQNHHQLQHQQSSHSQSPRRGGGGGAASTGGGAGKNRRFFFPETGFFGGRKVKNLDWKLTEAVEQVQSLRLDGSSDTPKNVQLLQQQQQQTAGGGGSSYDPPSPTALGRLPL